MPPCFLSVETDGSTLNEFLRASCAVLEEYGENENIETLEACGAWKVECEEKQEDAEVWRGAEVDGCVCGWVGGREG